MKGNFKYSISFRAKANTQQEIRKIEVLLSSDGEKFEKIATPSNDATSFEWTTPAIDAENVSLRLNVWDGAGRRTSQDSPLFRIISHPPKLTLISPNAAFYTNASSVAYTGECAQGLPVVLSVPGRVRELIDCNEGIWNYRLLIQNDGEINFAFSQSDEVGNVTTIEARAIRDTVAPTVESGSLVINQGVSSSIKNVFPISFGARDLASPVLWICVASAQGGEPELEDSCWVNISSPDQPNIRPALRITIHNYFASVGFLRGEYALSVWVKDSAGNVSAPQSGLISFQPELPPEVSNVIAASIPSPSSPLTLEARTAPQGSTLFLKWNVQSSHLQSGGIRLFYTTDDTNYIPIAGAAALSNAANGSCAIDAAASGCFVWTNGTPSSSYFRIRVAATDSNGLTSFGLSNMMNSRSFNSIAGNTDRGIGASGLSASIHTLPVAHSTNDNGNFVVRKDGVIFFRDPSLGILTVNPDNGVQRVFIPAGPAQSGDGGPAENARLKRPHKIALDFRNGLLIQDIDRIRRVDFDTGKIDTLIGGGQSTADGVAPKEVRFTQVSYGGQLIQSPLIPLPNGDLVFQSDQYVTKGARIRVYSASRNTVESIYPHGVGDSKSPTEDIVNCTTIVASREYPCVLSNPTVEFNPVTGVLTNILVAVDHVVVGSRDYIMAVLKVGPELGLVNPDIDPKPYYTGQYDIKFTGRDGKLYAMSRIGARVSRFDNTLKKWVRIFGSAVVGDCEDGTPALSCSVEIQSSFVDAQGRLFIMSRGRIRVVQDGKIYTVTGQSLHFGDGRLATSARFASVNSIDVSNAGEIFVMDSSEVLIRKFSIGSTITTIAGNSITGAPPTDKPAKGSPLYISGPQADFDYFRVNPDTGEILMHRGRGTLAKLNAATGMWQDFATYSNPDYVGSVFGFDGTNALVGTVNYDRTLAKLVNSQHRSFRLSDGAVTFSMGDSGIVAAPGQDYCADGTALDACRAPINYAGQLLDAVFDGTHQRWLFGRPSLKRIAFASLASGATMQTLVNLDNPIRTFTYRVRQNREEIYYCGTNGKLYFRALEEAHDVALEWPVASVQCAGHSLAFHPTRNSLLFPTLQNDAPGVGEYTLP